MSEIRKNRSDAATRSALAAVVIMSLIATAFSGYLWAASIRLRASGAVGPLPLCPETDLISCGEVLASRYSQWLGIPLAGVGTIHYALLLVVGAVLMRTASPSARRVLWTAGLLLAGLGALCGLWLVVVQAFLLHRYCLLCDLCHACGLVSLLVLLVYRPADVPRACRDGAGAAALAGALVLMLGQLLVHPEVIATSVIITPSTQPGSVALSTQPSAGSQPAAGSRPAAFVVIPAVRPANAFDMTDAAGTVIATLDMDNEIILGDPKAARTIVEFMDFGCKECKQEYDYLQEIMKQHPHWFRLVILLYPGNKECNAYTNRELPHVCEIARAAAAIRKHRPEYYQEAHTMFFKLQTLPLTGGMAWNLVKELCKIDDAVLSTWQNDPSLAEKIKRDTDIVHAIFLSQKARKTMGLPGLFASGKMINGAAESASRLENYLAQLIGPPDAAASRPDETTRE